MLMKTKVLTVNLREREKAARSIEQAAKAISAGEVIVYPTETSYGLGADATNPQAVARVYELKGRPEGKPLPIIVSDLGMAKEYAEINPVAEELARAFMPGPLTLIVDKKPSLPDALSKQGVAFRIPSNHFARAITSESGKPVTSTSANESDKPPIYRESEVRQAFDGKVPLILTSGDLTETLSSTIIDTRCYPPKLVREGPVPFTEIMKVLDSIAKKAEESMPHVCPPADEVQE